MEYKDRLFELEKQMYGITFDKSIQNLREKYNASDILESIGYLVCGPMYVGFCEQAVQIAKTEGIKLILPVMREGMLYKSILDILLEDETDFTVIPIWVSRKTSCLCMPESEFNFIFFKEICLLYPKKISAAFTRLGLAEHRDLYEQNEEEIDKELVRGNENWMKRLYGCINEAGLIPMVVERINRAKKGLSEYLQFVGANDDFLTMDIGTHGMIPRAIDNCTFNSIKKTHFYLKSSSRTCLFREIKNDIRPIFRDGKVETREYNVDTLIFSHLWETITMGDIDRGTAIEYYVQNSEVDVICEQKVIDQYTFDTVKKIKKGIIEFTHDYMQLRKNESVDTYKMLLDGVGSFYRMIEHPQKVEAELLGAMYVSESARSQDMRLISNNNSITRCRELFNQKYWDINAPIWIQGAITMRDPNSLKQVIFNCVVFGAGQNGMRAIKWIYEHGGQVSCIIDNHKCGSSYDGIPIVGIDALGGYDVEDILIGSTDFENVLEDQLLKYMKANKKAYNIHYIKR